MKHEKPGDLDRDDGPLVEAFVARAIAAYGRTGLPLDELASAMFAAAVNLIIDDIGEEDAARMLAGMASQLFPVSGAGHA